MKSWPLERWQAEAKRFEFHHHKFYYWTSDNGNKPPLLLIHGFPSASWDWSPIWEKLSEHFYVIAIDMLGFGFSCKNPSADYSINFQADLQQALLSYLNIQRYSLVAHDYGDTVAQELLARDLEQRNIRQAILLNGGLFPETHRALPVQKLLLSPLGNLVPLFINQSAFCRSFEKICHQPIDSDELNSLWTLLQYQQGHKVMPKLINYIRERRKKRERWVGALQQTSARLTLINGLKDPISGEHMVARYRQLVSKENIIELPQAGHYPQLEQPQQVYDAILSSMMTS